MWRGIMVLLILLGTASFPWLGVELVYAIEAEIHIHDHSAISSECRILLENAVGQFVTDYFTRAYHIEAVNDVECVGHHESEHAEDRELMANIAVLVDSAKDLPFYYGVFHIHFSKDGNWIPREGTLEYPWYPTEDSHVWHNAWCEFLNSSYKTYKKELGKFHCS